MTSIEPNCYITNTHTYIFINIGKKIELKMKMNILQNRLTGIWCSTFYALHFDIDDYFAAFLSLCLSVYFLGAVFLCVFELFMSLIYVKQKRYIVKLEQSTKQYRFESETRKSANENWNIEYIPPAPKYKHNNNGVHRIPKRILKCVRFAWKTQICTKTEFDRVCFFLLAQSKSQTVAFSHCSFGHELKCFA